MTNQLYVSLVIYSYTLSFQVIYAEPNLPHTVELGYVVKKGTD